MATDNRYQLWLEVADDSGKVGLVFEDGAIVNAPEPKTLVQRVSRKKKQETQEQELSF